MRWFRRKKSLEELLEDYMAAIDDLNTAISNLSSVSAAVIAALKNVPVDNSAAIAAAAANINSVTAELQAAVTPATPAPAAGP